VLQILADQLAVAIENARLYQQAQAALEETQALYQAARDLTAATTIEGAARALLAHLPVQGVDRYVLAMAEDPEAQGEERVLQARLIWDRERGLFTEPRRYTAAELPIIARELTREPIFVPDVATDPWLDETSRAFYLRHRVRSIAFFPLWAGDVFWGWLIAQGVQRPLELDGRTVRRLQALADTAAVVFQNRRLFELLEQRLREQALLYEVAASLAEASGPVELLTRICRAFTLGLGATSAYVNRESSDGQGFFVMSEFYAPEAMPEERISDVGTYYRYEDYPLYAQMRWTRQPVVLRRSELEARGAPEAQLLARYGGRTVLLLPLLVGEQYYGHVEIWDSRRERWFSGEEIRLATTLAHGAALALQRQGLFEEAARRARLLQAAAEVSRITATILDPDRLMAEAVERIRERFDYYYVGWFVPDAEGRWMVLAAGTGEPGRIMKERGHRLEIGGQSMVGWAAAHRRARIALDVGAEPVRFANPLLPLTRSEIALPMLVRGELVGVLDIQSEQPAAFTEEDIQALQVMADQLATAWQNARLYAQAQAQAEELATPPPPGPGVLPFPEPDRDPGGRVPGLCGGAGGGPQRRGAVGERPGCRDGGGGVSGPGLHWGPNPDRQRFYPAGDGDRTTPVGAGCSPGRAAGDHRASAGRSGDPFHRHRPAGGPGPGDRHGGPGLCAGPPCLHARGAASGSDHRPAGRRRPGERPVV
jgi:GAF domain-containing protein